MVYIFCTASFLPYVRQLVLLVFVCCLAATSAILRVIDWVYIRKGGECGVERPGRVLPEWYSNTLLAQQRQRNRRSKKMTATPTTHRLVEMNCSYSTFHVSHAVVWR